MNAKEFELKIENAINSKTNKEKNIVSEMEQVKDLMEEKGIFFNFQNATKSLIYYLFLLNSKLSIKNRISILETYFSQPFFKENMKENFITDWIVNQNKLKKQEKVNIKSYTEDDEEFSSLVTPFTSKDLLKFMLTYFNEYGVVSSNTNNLLYLKKPNDKLDEKGKNVCISKYCNKYKLNNKHTYQADFDSQTPFDWKSIFPKKNTTKNFTINVYELLNYISIIEKTGLCYINREKENFIVTFKNEDVKFSFNILLLKDILTTLLKLGIEESKVYFVESFKGFHFTDAKKDEKELIDQDVVTIMPTILSSGLAVDFYFDLDENSIFYADKYFGYAFQLKVTDKENKNIKLINEAEKEVSKDESNKQENAIENKSNLDYLIGMEFYSVDEKKHRVTSIDNDYVYHVEIDKPSDYPIQEMTKINDFKKTIESQGNYKKDSNTKSDSDLDYLKGLLATSNDLLDLISDTGEKEDITFIKEKIQVTKDLISLLDENYAFGGQISTSSPFAIENVDNWNQIPSTWKNTSIINRVKVELNPLDKKFQSIFNVFLGQDELRPVFSGYNVDDFGITVTDAHKLAHIPVKLNNKGIFNPNTGELVDGKYPNVENVIKTEYQFSKKFSLYKLLQFCKVAKNYVNPHINQVAFNFKDENNNTFKVGYNVEFLQIIIEASIKYGYDELFINVPINQSHGTVISNVSNPKYGRDLIFLIMPVGLYNREDKYSSQDLDYGLSLSCFFDFSKNEIINGDGSVVDFKLDYGLNPIFTDEVIKIIKSSLQKNPTLQILENFKVEDGFAKVTNMKGYSYSVSIPNINVPQGLYYIKNNVAVKNENADSDDFVKDIDLSKLNKLNSIKLKKDYFNYLINTAKLYIGDDELRPALTGINLNYDGKDLIVGSTNANILSRLKVNDFVEYENNNAFSMILPIYNINTLLDSNEDEFIKLDVYSSNSNDSVPVQLIIKSSSFILKQRLIDSKYPNYNAVIPNTQYFEINLNKKKILDAIKSKESESFIKRNKKNNINISAEKNNGKLSINLYSTSQSKYSNLERIEQIEILNTDLYFDEKETTTTDSCLLLMPMMSDSDVVNEIIFAFSLKLFKDFIAPVNTENFDICYSEKNRAYIINQEFFKYRIKLTKPVKTDRFIDERPVITKIETKKQVENIEKEDDNLQFLKSLLTTTENLLDLISDTGGDKSDIDFLKEKIQVTKDLISLI